MPFILARAIPRDESHNETAKFDEETKMSKAERLLRYSALVRDRKDSKLNYGMMTDLPVAYFSQSNIPVSRRKEIEGRPLFEMGVPWHHALAAAQTLLQFPKWKEIYQAYALCLDIHPTRFRCVDEALALYESTNQQVEKIARDCPSFLRWATCIDDCNGEMALCRWQQLDYENCMLKKHPSINYMTFPQPQNNIGGPVVHRDGQGYPQRMPMKRMQSIWTGYM